MDISLELLLTEFQRYDAESRIICPDRSIMIRQLQLFPGSKAELSRQCLYVLNAEDMNDSDAVAVHFGPGQSPILCVAPWTSDKKTLKEYGKFKSGCTYLVTRKSFAEIYNLLQKAFFRFQEWHNQLSLAVLREAPFQEFIDLSEDLLRSPMLIYDPALKMMAHTKRHAGPEDVLFQKSVELGYLEYEAFKYFSEEHLLEELEEKGTVQGQGGQPFRVSPDYIRTINVGNELAIYCVILYNEELSNQYSDRVFQILCDHLQELLEKQQHDFTKGRTISDYLLEEILNSPSMSAEQIRQRTAYSDLSYFGNYVLISLHYVSSGASSDQFFIQSLRRAMISCRVFPYQDHIVILYNLPKFRDLTYKSYLTDRWTETLTGFSDRKPVMYVSKPFADLSAFAAAYEQAENTVLLSGAPQCLFYYYEDYLLDDFIYMNAAKDPLFSYCCPWLLELSRDGSRKSVQLLTVLKAYLDNNLKPTDTAAQLGMHRNNVIYHIKNLEDTYNLDLSDPEELFKIRISFLLLQSREKSDYTSPR